MAEQKMPAESTRRRYVAPAVKVMDEAEVLKAFQITSAGASWWTG